MIGGVRTLIASGVAALCVLVWATLASAATVVSYPDFTNSSGMTAYGTASFSDELNLTDGGGYQVGSAFTSSGVLDGTRSFKAKFSFRIIKTGGRVADGFTFSLLRDDSQTLGLDGSGLGYENLDDSVAVAFDTFGRKDKVKLLKNGALSPVVKQARVLKLHGDAPLFAWVDYAANRKTIEIRLSDEDVKPQGPLISEELNVGRIIRDQAHVGFTGATGGFSSDQSILSVEVTQPGN